MKYLIPIAATCFLSGCVDSIEPAGPGQYENPHYPSDYFGYVAVPVSWSGAFCHDNRVYVLDTSGDRMISFSLDDPAIPHPGMLANKDTLLLGVTPGSSNAFEPAIETLFFSEHYGYDVYRLQGLSSGFPERIYTGQSVFTDLYVMDGGQSLLLCLLGPEWAVKRINATTGELEGQFNAPWPINRAALSPDGTRMLLSNSGEQVLLEIATGSMEQINSFSLPERPGPFLYNTSGDIVLFNQYTLRPMVYLYDGNTGEELMSLSTINSYRLCSLIPGTNVVIAPRRSDSRVSVLNTDNMIFAPSLYTMQYPKLAFVSPDGEYLLVLTDAPGRVYVFRRP